MLFGMKKNYGGILYEYLFFLTPKEKVAHTDTDDTLRQALEKMEHHGYSAIPLLDLDGKYVGTITEGDMLWYIKDNDFPRYFDFGCGT